MNTGSSRSSERAGQWLGLALLLLCTPAMAADDEGETSEVEQEYDIGVYLLDDDAWRFGKFTGLKDDGAEALFNFRLESHPEWNSGETRSWSLQGWRLGLDSRRLKFEYANQGSWEFEADYREIPNYRFNDGVTPFLGAGTDRLELPADWVAPVGGSTAYLDALHDHLNPVSSRIERKRLDLEFEKEFSRDWGFDVKWRHETKEGVGTTGAAFGFDGLNPRAVVLPSPVDWETDIMEATLNFGNSRYQFGATVYASWFSNDRQSLTWQNPYGARNDWAFAAGYPLGYGRMALDPDNEALQFRLFGGVNLSATSRLSADVAFGSMEQDETLLDYTVNPYLTVDSPLPLDSPDAKIDTTHANVRYSARPLDRLSLLVNYTLDERDNETPRATWAYIGGDSQNQRPESEARINLPFSYEKQEWDVTATWRATRGVRVKGGLEQTDYERSYTEVLDSDETRLFAGVALKRWEKASVSLDVASSERDVDDYTHNRPYLLYRVPGSASDDEFDNLPALRKYNQTDRKRDEYRLRADFFPVEKFSFAFTGASYDDDYDDPEGRFGLQESEVTSWSLDAGYYPTETVSVTAYYTDESYDSAQNGRMWTNLVTAADPANDWQARVEDEVETWNVSVQLQGFGEESPWSDRLKLGMDYTFSQVESDIRVSGGSNIPALPLPTLLTEMSSWSVFGSYDINERAALRLAYEQQELTSNDFALDDVPIDGSPSVILLGESAANYDVSLVMLYLSYRY